MQRVPTGCSPRPLHSAWTTPLALLTSIALAFSLVGCGSFQSSATKSSEPGITATKDASDSPEANSVSSQQSLLAEAQEDPAVSTQQIEILKQVEIVFADYESAMERMFSCMEAANVKVNRNGTTSREGATVLDYTFDTSDTSDQAYADCHNEHAKYIDFYWQTSTPEGISYNARRAEELAPAMRACLENLGADVPLSASFKDLERLATEYIAKMFETDDPSYDCYERIGYSTWNG